MKYGSFRRAATGLCLAAALTMVLPAAGQPPAAPPAAGKAAQQPRDTTEELKLETSDGAAVVAWYYPVEEETTAVGTVILVHDLGGSHLTVEPLAKTLQAAGYCVVTPDLRGHGKSVLKNLPAQDDQSKLLKKPDFEIMAATRGGQKRDQSAVRGDIECVRNWIRQQAESNKIPLQPLFVVGSGLGASLAATWTAADALWPDLATGPQGREVNGLILVSPTFTTKGYSIAPALASDALRRSVPMLVIAGVEDRDAVKVFDQLKRQRPRSWFDSRHPVGDERDSSPVPAADASLLLLVNQAPRSGDALAALRSADPRARGSDPAALIIGFMKLTAAARR